MARKRYSSPTITITITDEQLDRAIRSNSGACLVSDAIAAQYPHLSRVTTDMATIRVTDREAGERYTYLTPPAVQHVLLSFDQGWPNPTRELTIKRAVHIAPVITTAHTPSGRAARERSAARLADLEDREQSGDALTVTERQTLTRLRSTWRRREAEGIDRPSVRGAPEVGANAGRSVVRGGPSPVVGPAHPNLLRGRDRHFGAKLADPGLAFREAVDQAVAQRLAEG